MTTKCLLNSGFVIRYRRNVFTKQHLEAMQAILANVCKDFEAGLVEFNGGHDHVHLLVNYPPKVALSTLVASLKGVSSRMLRQQSGDFHPGSSVAACFGLRPVSRRRAAGLHWISCANASSSSRLRTKPQFPAYPGLNSGACAGALVIKADRASRENARQQRTVDPDIDQRT
jgi:REP element-mobilizing transposase RayT